MELRKKIGELLAKLRKERGLSQNNLSWDTNINPRYMSDIELGKRNISTDKLKSILDYYGIKFSEFFRMMEDG